MNLHKQDRLRPRDRALLVQRIEQGLRVEEAAQAAGISVRTAYKWLRRFRQEGELACKIAYRNRGAARMPPQTPCLIALSNSVGHARPIDRSPTTWAWPSARWHVASKSSACITWQSWSRRHRCCATNTPSLAICCIWTSRKNLGAFANPATV